MDETKLRALTQRETDVVGALYRVNNDEKLYLLCLKEFLEDNSVKELKEAIAHSMWDNAFTAAHALKGLAGNLGFVPLMHATGQLVVIIRGGRISEVGGALQTLESCHRDICDAIKEVTREIT